jgi:hypothetical protein
MGEESPELIGIKPKIEKYLHAKDQPSFAIGKDQPRMNTG